MSTTNRQTNTPIIEQLRDAIMQITQTKSNLIKTPIDVKVRKLPPEAAIGENTDKDYPIYKGKEGIVEASFLGSKGQAFSPAPADFDGNLGDILALRLDGDDTAALSNRGVFIAAVNAMCRHLGIADRTVHCKNEDLRECAMDLANEIKCKYPPETRIALVGCQPRMIESLSPMFTLRVVDLDPENIGKEFTGGTIEGEEKTDECLDWCDLALVTGSTIANGTIDRFVNLNCETVFYGITISAAAALLGLNRFCARGQ